MRKLGVGFILLLFTLDAFAGPSITGLHCGTRGSLLGTIASDFLIPDYFPPENPLLRAIFVNPLLINLAMCEENHDPVSLGESCVEHDRCYGTLGATKDACDDALLSGWIAACNGRYTTMDATSSMCNDACTAAAELMHAAMRYNDGFFCPSCIAFERDQEKARNKDKNVR